MFIDKASLRVKAGNGGNGMIAFRREKYVDKGGPSGGDGGRGGSIYFIADSGLTTLMDFKYQSIIEAKNGDGGHGKNAYGRAADDLHIKVPVGTVVTDIKTGRIIADFCKPNQEILIAKGGRGGRGNSKFANSVNQTPRVAENGEQGENLEISLELKLLADVGLVGFPSVGKSTLLSVVSSARPEIAAYQFTTLVPNLGVVAVKGGKSFVMADLPGLIEGAHVGKGLGIQFLRHIERCRVLVHVVDMAITDGRNPIDDFRIINDELKSYNLKLLERPMIVAANKMDDEGSWLVLDEFKKVYGDKYEIFPISGLTHFGIDSLLYRISSLLEQTPEFSLIDDENISKEIAEFEYKGDDPGFVIGHPSLHSWVITGDRVEKLYKMTNISTDEGLLHLTRIMRKMGIEKELERLGVREGDTITLCDFEFEYYD